MRAGRHAGCSCLASLRCMLGLGRRIVQFKDVNKFRHAFCRSNCQPWMLGWYPPGLLRVRQVACCVVHE